MLGLILMISAALGQEAIKLEVIHTVHAPKQPQLVVLPQLDASTIAVDLNCSDVPISHRTSARAGARIAIDIPVPPGVHTCSGTLEAAFTDATTGGMPLRFQVAVQDPISMTVSMADLDLSQRKVRVNLNQPVAQLAVDVYGEQGTRIGSASAANIRETPAELQWEQGSGEVVRIAITGTGASGLSTSLDLFPWSYKVPHDEVVFASGSAEIAPSEEPKLEVALARINGVLAKFSVEKMGFDVPLQLYIAGYTDTVGDKVSNRTLSTRRAQSLARWFKQSGFSRTVHYQGFGESVLAVATGDEVDEAANRRALYIIAAETPPQSAALPTQNWSRLR